MHSQQAEVEVIEFTIPNYQIHGNACKNECHGNYTADVTRVMDREFNIDNTLTVKVKKSFRSSPTKTVGAEGGQTEHPESKPQSKEEKDKGSVGSEHNNAEVLKGTLRLSTKITPYMAWKNILPECRSIFL